MSENYSEHLDELDAMVFSGELLNTNLEEFEEYLARWSRAIVRHKTCLTEVEIEIFSD